MFVEEAEQDGVSATHGFRPFMISTADDVTRLTGSNLMTVVIDVRKGVDVEPGAEFQQPFDAGFFEAQLLANSSARDIHQARKCIGETKPQIRMVLSDARINGAFTENAANAAVEKIMTSAMDNAGALVAVAKLKQKDQVTFLHSLAVSALMVAFGRALGHCEEDVRLLGIGGLVHDLGKIALPTSILTKTGKLAVEEMDLVRAHPRRGYELVSSMENPPQQVLDICLYHHEKFDGSGYPSGLAGAKIPYVARLAAICDVYDALTTIRPYKRAWSQGEAVKMMMNSPGHFDTDLLSAFVSKMIINGTLH
jgi:HD-GYP domain-containing protein (c-di-GMP phosphodiesterase class II)